MASADLLFSSRIKDNSQGENRQDVGRSESSSNTTGGKPVCREECCFHDNTFIRYLQSLSRYITE